MIKYLDIKHAALHVHRHERTIRRVIVQNREEINKKEGYKVIKYNGKKYLISVTYLNTRYGVTYTKETEEKIDREENTVSLEALRELQETNKMYSFMLSEKDKLLAEKDKQIELLKSQSEILERQITFQNLALDQAQKLSALEKQLELKKLEN